MYTYTPTTWANDEAPAINATNLNNIETGIDNAQKELDWFVNGTAVTAIADGDILRIYDASASAYRKITKANFVSGLLTSAVAASTYEPIKGADDNYVTDAEKTVIGNTSGANTGDETVTSIGSLINGATGKTTPVDADMVGLMDSAAANVLKKLSWANIKATLKTYFDTLYAAALGADDNYVTDAEKVVIGNTSGTNTGDQVVPTDLTDFTDQTAWRIFYSNADGDVTELAFGTSGKVLQSNGASAAPTWETPAGGGDMLAATYDPLSVAGDAFDMDNMVQGSTNYFLSSAELSVVQATSGSNTGDETATSLGATINGATGKTTPVDADLIGLVDSAAANILKKLTWANVKATLKTYFDTLYSATGALFDVVDDTTPTLGGTLDASDEIIQDAKIVTFNAEVDDGNATGTDTIDFGAGQKHKSTLTANCTFTFTAPANGIGNFVLKAVNFGAFTPTFPASVLWSGGTEPTWTASGTDIISLYWDGTNWYGTASLDFS